MKVKLTLFLSSLFVLVASVANSDQEEIEPDFLNFLIEMEEATGNGFETWLETDTKDETEKDK